MQRAQVLPQRRHEVPRQLRSERQHPNSGAKPGPAHTQADWGPQGGALQSGSQGQDQVQPFGVSTESAMGYPVMNLLAHAAQASNISPYMVELR